MLHKVLGKRSAHTPDPFTFLVKSLPSRWNEAISHTYKSRFAGEYFVQF